MHKKQTWQTVALTEDKNELKRKVLHVMPEDKLSTAHFKLTRYTVVNVKTSLDSARALGCVITKEDVGKARLKRLHEEGVPVPDVQTTISLRLSEG